MAVLGIDGGGTSTRALLLDVVDGRATILGVGKSGPSSVDTVSPQKTAESINDAVQKAFAVSATNSKLQIESAFAGIGGIVSAADSKLVADILAGLPQATKNISTDAVNDMKIALAGGTVLEPGITCIMGTGSVAYGRTASGQEHKTGGWGWKEGDPGSSFDLGISAIRAMVRAGDGRRPTTPFTDAVFARLGMQSVDDITTILYQKDMTRTEIAGLAPLVTTWADKGDPVALAIITRASQETAEMIGTVFDRLFASNPEPKRVPVAIVGSLGNAPGVLRDKLQADLAAWSPRLHMHAARLEPVVGAALWALRMKLGNLDKVMVDTATLVL